jgi:phosphatidylserine/phosphatidylglycerophosphate/cardiolipin synthase-like enzyme
MTCPLCLLTIEDLRQLSGALRAGRLGPPLTPILLRRYVPDRLVDCIANELQQRIQDGMQPRHIADLIDVVTQDRLQRPVAEDLIDLVWTGPEGAGIVNRDTGVVVRELFQNARESVLVAGFAVYQGHMIFKTLAERMDENLQLKVQMFLDVQRPFNEHASPSELVRRFAERFTRPQWPGKRLPSLYYDPRSLESEHVERATLHAKCIVIDKEQAFVSSANFTEAAQTKNIEVGVRLRSAAFARRLAEHFEALASSGILKPVPLG